MKGIYFLYNYNPINNANAIQNQRFIEGIKNVDIDSIIITREGDSNNETIANSDKYSKKLNYFARHTIRQIAYFPDIEYYTWTKPTLRKVQKIVNFSEFDFIHTNSLPNSTHLIGAHLKKRYGLPWVAHFYEPWTDNYFMNYKYGFIKNLNLKYESVVAEQADIIIHTNQYLKEVWKNKYGEKVANKIKVLPLCTDEQISLKAGEKNHQKNKVTIIHAGGLYGERNLKLLIQALLILKEKIDLLEDYVEFKIIGTISPNDINKIKTEGLSGIFQILGKKPYAFVKESIESSDVLLVIEALQPDANLFFPSKLCEYFSYNKPIIGLTSKESITRYHLSKANHSVFGPGEQIKLSSFLEELILKKNPINFDQNYFTNFLPSQIAIKYKLIIEEMLKKNYR